MMVAMSMEREICWKPGWIERVLDTEALDVPDELFLATHHPIKMYKKTSRHGTGQAYDEQKFLQDFLKTEDYMFTWILGEAGTGKSHLVRWMAAQIQESEKRRVLLIPRSGTNLRQILQLILKGLEGSPFQEYRERLDRIADNLTPERAREMMRSQIAIAIGPTGNGQPKTEEQEYFKEELHHLFQDPYFRDLLLKDGGIIHRLTDHVLGQNQETQRLVKRREFTVDDLPLLLRDIQNASKLARDVYGMLLSDEALKQQAVDWINASLNDAISMMLNFQGADLVKLMEDVRAALAEQGVELVLLIEDFAVLQGIDLQLLDALLVKPRQLDRPLCSLRVALACTTGYYNTLPDTVRTRVQFRVDLDVKADGTLMQKETLTEFVSRYLNVLRLPEVELNGWYQDRLNGQVTGEAPSACSLRECPYQEQCHHGFGQVGGRGLYPFNDTAVQVMYERLFDKSNPEFNPRILIKDVLRHILENYGEHIREGQFPSPSMFEHLGGTRRNRLDALSINALRQADLATAPRRQVLLELWSQTRELGDLDPVIHQAFALPPLGGKRVGEEPTIRTTPEPIDPVTRQPAPVPKREVTTPIQPEPVVHDPKYIELQAQLEALNLWQQGGEMSQALTQTLRPLLYRAINERIDWNGELLIFALMKETWRSASLGFARGPRIQPQFQLQLPLKEEELNNTAIALQGLLRYQYYGNWHFPNGPQYFRIWARFLEAWGQEVVRRLKVLTDNQNIAWDPVPSSVEVMTVHMLMQGELTQSQATDRQIEALFAASKPASGMRSRPWQRLQENLIRHQKATREILLSRISCTKGIARKAKIIDASQVIPSMRKIVREGTLTARVPDYDWNEFTSVLKSHRELSKDLGEAVQAEQAHQKQWYERVTEGLGTEPPTADILFAMGAAISRAKEAAIWSGPDPAVVKTVMQSFKSLPVESCLKQASFLQSELSLGEQLEKLGRIDLKTMESMDQFVQVAGEFLTKTTNKVDLALEQLNKEHDIQNLDQVKQDIHKQFELLSELLAEGQGGDPSDSSTSRTTGQTTR